MEVTARKEERAKAAEVAKALVDKAKALAAKVEEYSAEASMVKKMFASECIAMGRSLIA
jgi:adenylylsulfate kinase-like enzyme